MAQYREIRTGYPLYLSDGTCLFRMRAEAGVLYTDQYSGGVWVGIDTDELPGGGENVFRVGSRGGYYVVDQELDTSPGFSGTIAVNWDNISEQSLAVPTTTTSSTSSTTTTTTLLDEELVITTTKSGTFEMTLYGSALDSVNVDWGDASDEDVALSPSGTLASHTTTGANVITITGAQDLTRIDSTGQSITALDIPSNLPSLTRMVFASNSLTSFTGQSGWTGLTYLNLAANSSLSTVTTSSAWTLLENLYLFNCSFSSIILHAEWTAITDIGLYNNSSLSSLTTHSEWVNLASLDVADCPSLTALATHAEWVAIQSIDIHDSGITSFATHSEWVAFQSIWADNLALTNLMAYSAWINMVTFRIAGGAISSATNVNNILIALDATGMSAGTIDLSGGTNVAPTGAGITAASNLTGRGVTVTTN